jgi:ABC-type antimicrobial peptide transport system permease subunit
LIVLLLIFAGIALLLNCFGIYAVMAYRVRRRSPEIGVRMAVGAQRSQITTMLVMESLAPVAVEIIGGAGLSFLMAGWLHRCSSASHVPTA